MHHAKRDAQIPSLSTEKAEIRDEVLMNKNLSVRN
jgi:hypothetical protein